jgi:short-subunit dehydrogenase
VPNALVTGASSGIGAAFATRLAARGYDLVVVARDEARLKERADDLIHRYGCVVEVLQADLADPVQLDRVAARLRAADRPVDLLVNNAGFALGRSFLRTDAADEALLLDVMVRAPLLLTHEALPGMVSRGSGGIINVASVAGWLPTGTYSAAKAWLIVFTESLAAQLNDSGVSVTATCPGYVRTQMHERAELNMTAIPSWAWQDADTVVDDALAALAAGRVVTVPGIGYRAAATVARLAPSRLVAAAMQRRKPRRQQ